MHLPEWMLLWQFDFFYSRIRMYCELVACRFPVLACQTVFLFFFHGRLFCLCGFHSSPKCGLSLSVSLSLSQCMHAHKFMHTNSDTLTLADLLSTAMPYVVCLLQSLERRALLLRTLCEWMFEVFCYILINYSLTLISLQVSLSLSVWITVRLFRCFSLSLSWIVHFMPLVLFVWI